MSEKVQSNKMGDLTQGPLFIKIIKYSLPIIATGLLQTFYNASDMIVVGNFSDVGATAMGAVGACGALINLILNLFIGLSVGTGVCVAQEFGGGRFDDLKKTIHTSLLASIIGGLAVGLFGFFMARPLLTLIGTPEATLNEAVPYMKAYFVGVPAAMVYNFMAAAIRSAGDTKRPLIILMISGAVNVALNLFLVLVFGMGAVGVGIATTVAQYMSAIMILWYMIKRGGHCSIKREDLKIDKKKLMRIVSIGIPAGLQSMLFSLSNVLIQSTVNTYGATVVDGNAAAGNIEGFVYIAMNSMYHAALTFTGQNVGAGQYKRIGKILVECLIIVTVIGLLLGVSGYIFGDTLLKIYAPDDAAVRAAGVNRLGVICALYFLCGLMEVGCGVLRGMGKSIPPMIISLLGSCVFRIVWIFTVCPFFPGDIKVLYLSYPISWIITTVAYLIASRFAYKEIVARTQRCKNHDDFYECMRETAKD